MLIASIQSILPSGILYLPQKEPKAVLLLWDNVQSVTVLKRDAFSYDLICMSFLMSNGDEIEFDEEDLHWKKLNDHLDDFLEGAKTSKDWFWDVAIPAFEACEQVVFSRKKPLL